MSKYVIGQDVTLYLWEGANPPLIAGCTTSQTIQLNREFVELTPLTDAFKSYLPTFIGGSLSFDSVVFFRGVDTTRADTEDHNDWVLNATLLNFRLLYESDDLGVSGWEGSCYVQSLSITGAVNNFATGQIQLLPTGTITKYEDYS